MIFRPEQAPVTRQPTTCMLSQQTRRVLFPLCILSVAGFARHDEPGAVPDPLAPPGIRVAMASDFSRYWPQGHPALFKLKGNLVLAIPPQHQQFWIQKDHVIRAPAPINRIPEVASVAFEFFLPDFTGYTPGNFDKPFDEDLVDVVDLQSADPKQTEPDAPGSYPPNMLKRALGTYLHPNEYQDQYGLRCYQQDTPKGLERVTCYGRRDEREKEDIMLYAITAARSKAVRFPIMQAEYFTRRYGGLRIVWRTNVKNLPRWRDIDGQIWNFIDNWNIADANGVVTTPQ
jgi:hypothetical protein